MGQRTTQHCHLVWRSTPWWNPCCLHDLRHWRVEQFVRQLVPWLGRANVLRRADLASACWPHQRCLHVLVEPRRATSRAQGTEPRRCLSIPSVLYDSASIPSARRRDQVKNPCHSLTTRKTPWHLLLRVPRHGAWPLPRCDWECNWFIGLMTNHFPSFFLCSSNAFSSICLFSSLNSPIDCVVLISWPVCLYKYFKLAMSLATATVQITCLSSLSSVKDINANKTEASASLVSWSSNFVFHLSLMWLPVSIVPIVSMCATLKSLAILAIHVFGSVSNRHNPFTWHSDTNCYCTTKSFPSININDKQTALREHLHTCQFCIGAYSRIHISNSQFKIRLLNCHVLNFYWLILILGSIKAVSKFG